MLIDNSKTFNDLGIGDGASIELRMMKTFNVQVNYLSYYFSKKYTEDTTLDTIIRDFSDNVRSL